MSDGDDSEPDDSPPESPVSVPSYISDSLQRQDALTLRRILAYGQQLANLTPDSPMMTTDFDTESLKAGDIVRHGSDKSTVKSNTGQIARVLGDEAVEIWDVDGSLQTIRKESVTAVSTASVDQSVLDRLKDDPGTDVGETDTDDAGE